MEYRAVASLVREPIADPPNAACARARLTARAAELGVPSAVVDDLHRLWTRRGWLSPDILQTDVEPAVIWN